MLLSLRICGTIKGLRRNTNDPVFALKKGLLVRSEMTLNPFLFYFYTLEG